MFDLTSALGRFLAKGLVGLNGSSAMELRKDSGLRRSDGCASSIESLFESDPLSSEQPDFDRLRKAHIAEECDHQDGPVHLRQVCEAQRRSKRRIR
jgi:hypothetical protein